MLILRFALGDRSFGIAASLVREILPVCRLRSVPLAPPYIAGDFLLRGVACPVLDLRRWLDGEPTRVDLATRMILLDWAGAAASGPLAVLGERVRDVVEVPATAVMPPAVGRAEELVLAGTVVIDGTIVGLLDPATLVDGELAGVLYARAGA